MAVFWDNGDRDARRDWMENCFQHFRQFRRRLAVLDGLNVINREFIPVSFGGFVAGVKIPDVAEQPRERDDVV